MNKLKTTIEEQVRILKSRNVKFNITSEEEAKRFLTEKSYYFKISAYRENFDYRILQNGDIAYKDLDFAYLKELSKIDMYLRYMILELTLDIEHYLKRWLIINVTNDIKEDGHTIVNNFLNNNQDINKKISQHAKSPYCSNLYMKYHEDLPIWVFAEISTFGDFLYFFNYYCDFKNIKMPIDNKIINQVKTLRNASAHNNCIINNLNKQISPKNTINADIKSWCKNICPNVNSNYLTKMLRKQFVYDFLALLYCYDQLAKENVKNKKMHILYNLFNNRFLKHKDYFKNNQRIISIYTFINTILSNLCKI